jgi:uncharacterized protein (DUF2225 family)
MALLILALLTKMIPQWETASSCPVLTTTFTKKEVFQASRAIVVPDMVGMGFCAGLFPTGKIETEIFPALMAEFEKVLIQDRTTNLTVKDPHSLQIPNPIDFPPVIRVQT